jgi:hypothetical protein
VSRRASKVAVTNDVLALLGALVDALRPRASLVMENVVLRQQLAVVKRQAPAAASPD